MEFLQCLSPGHSPQNQPLDFSRMDVVGDLSPGMMAMDNFDDGELDQYLPLSTTARSCRASMAPPPPYATDSGVNALPSSSANSSWMASSNFRMTSSTAVGGVTSSSASGILQRMAGGQVVSDSESNATLSPNSDSTSPPKDSCNGYPGNPSGYDTSDVSTYQPNLPQSSSTVKMEPYRRELKQSYDQYPAYQMNSQTTPNDDVNDYAQQQHHMQQQQYYNMAGNMNAIPGYSQMPSRTLYAQGDQPTACSLNNNTSAQWKYAHIWLFLYTASYMNSVCTFHHIFVYNYGCLRVFFVAIVCCSVTLNIHSMHETIISTWQNDRMTFLNNFLIQMVFLVAFFFFPL